MMNGGTVGIIATSQFNPERGLPSMWHFTLSPCGHVGLLQVLWFSCTVQKHAGVCLVYCEGLASHLG